MIKLIARVLAALLLVSSLALAAVPQIDVMPKEDEPKFPAAPNNEEEISDLEGRKFGLIFADFCLEARDLFLNRMKSASHRMAGKLFFDLHNNAELQSKTNKILGVIDKIRKRAGLLTPKSELKNACKSFKQIRNEIDENFKADKKKLQNLETTSERHETHSSMFVGYRLDDCHCITSQRVINLDVMCDKTLENLRKTGGKEIELVW